MLSAVSFLKAMLGGQRNDESIRGYVTRLASRPSSGVAFLPAAFRGLVDLYRHTDDLNARLLVVEAEVTRLRSALDEKR